MSAYTSLMVDIAMLCALAFTLFQGFRLSARFDRLHADRALFDQLIAALDRASTRAEQVIAGLKVAAAESAEELQKQVNVARGLSEELTIVIEAGDALAARLMDLAERSRKATTGPLAGDVPLTKDEDVPRSRAEKELLEALKGRRSG